MIKRQSDKIFIVEGKYDKIRLENIIDAVIITTEGFGIFNSPEKREMIKRLSENRELIILTDSDSAGNLIRSHIATITGKKNIRNIYAPRIKGKEKRKASPGKEGILGIEGTDDEILLSILEKSGVFSSEPIKTNSLTKADLYKMGFYGVDGASEKRKAFLRENDLPDNISPTAFLDAVNLLNLL